MPDLPLDVVFETAFGYPAESFLLRVTDAAEVDDEPVYTWTNRRGVRGRLFGTQDENPLRGDDPTLVYRVPTSLVHQPDRLTDLLTDLWQSPTSSSLRRRVKGYRRRTTGTHPLHGDEATPGPGTLRLQLDYWYDLTVDWAFPYCLRPDGEETRLFPANLGRSVIRGQPLTGPRSVISDRRTVKFVREGDGFVTVEWRPGGEHRRHTPRGLGGDLRRPRVVLPHTGGFVLLHKIFRMTTAAEHELVAYREARHRLQRDAFLLSRLARLYSLSYGMCDPRDEDARAVRGLIDQVHPRVHALQQSVERRLGELDELARGSATLAWLAGDLWRDRSLARAWSSQWHELDSFLGPLSFLAAALWTVRDSPLEGAFYGEHGAELLHLPPRPTRRPSEAEDPLLINDAYQPPTPEAGLSSAVGYLGKSLTLWTEANTWFAHRHAAALMRVEIQGGVRPGAVRIMTEDIERFIEFVTEGDRGAVREHVRDVASGLRRGGHQPYREAVDGFHARLRRLDSLQRATKPKLGELLDTFSSVLALVSFVESMQADRWDTNQLIDFGQNVLGATEAGSIFLAEAGAERLGSYLGPIVAAADIAVAVRGAHLAYVEGRDSAAMVGAAKAVGAALIGASSFLGAFPGAGPICVGAGTLISVGAEVYSCVREHLRDDWEREALGLHALLFPEEEPRDFNVHGDHGAYWTGPGRARRASGLVAIYGRYLRVLQQHVLEKSRWKDHHYRVTGTFGEQRPTLAVVLDEGDVFANFPEYRWRYVDGEQRDARQGYIDECRAIDARWNRAAPGEGLGARHQTMAPRSSPPGSSTELPPPPPLPHGRPRTS